MEGAIQERMSALSGCGSAKVANAAIIHGADCVFASELRAAQRGWWEVGRAHELRARVCLAYRFASSHEARHRHIASGSHGPRTKNKDEEQGLRGPSSPPSPVGASSAVIRHKCLPEDPLRSVQFIAPSRSFRLLSRPTFLGASMHFGSTFQL